MNLKCHDQEHCSSPFRDIVEVIIIEGHHRRAAAGGGVITGSAAAAPAPQPAGTAAVRASHGSGYAHPGMVVGAGVLSLALNQPLPGAGTGDPFTFV